MIDIIKLGNRLYKGFEEFSIDEDGVKTWNIPQDVPSLQAIFIDTVKLQAGAKLKDTDWAVVKCTELGLVLADKYPTIATQRATVREWSNTKEAEILACSTVDEVLALDIKL